MAKLETIEGIGPAFAKSLRKTGVRSTLSLLKKGATKSGRNVLAESSGISEALILEWVNQADLRRVRGIGEEYADLLEEVGVDTVPELARRNPGNLYKAMVTLNDTQKLVRQLPSQEKVSEWVHEAKTLPRVVSY